MIKFNATEHRYGIETRRSFEYTLDWLHEHACSRSYGLGMYQLGIICEYTCTLTIGLCR